MPEVAAHCWAASPRWKFLAVSTTGAIYCERKNIQGEEEQVTIKAIEKSGENQERVSGGKTVDGPKKALSGQPQFLFSWLASSMRQTFVITIMTNK